MHFFLQKVVKFLSCERKSHCMFPDIVFLVNLAIDDVFTDHIRPQRRKSFVCHTS